MSQLRIDVSTLSGWSDLADGDHTITVKAKASGYRDSEESEGVTVSKEPNVYTVNISYDNADVSAVACSSDEDGTSFTVLTAPYQVPSDKPYIVVQNPNVGNNTLVSATGGSRFITGFKAWSSIAGALIEINNNATIVLHMTGF